MDAPPVEVAEVTSGGAALVEVLSAAFAADPWMRWTLPDSRSRRSLFSIFLRTVAFPIGRVLVAGPSAGAGGPGSPVGVAVLTGPGVVAPEDDAVGEMVMALHGRRLGRALDGEAVLQRHRPDGARWVLHTLGVEPRWQRHGVGSALLEAAIALGTDGGELTLETSSPAARAWYRRRGFVEDAEVALADHGLGADAPTVWLLRRP